MAASQLIPRPEMPTSASEVHEWWLVSPDLAAKLRAERSPVIQFCELNMWGREATGTALEDDEELLAAIGPTPPRRASRESGQYPAGVADRGPSGEAA